MSTIVSSSNNHSNRNIINNLSSHSDPNLHKDIHLTHNTHNIPLLRLQTDLIAIETNHSMAVAVVAIYQVVMDKNLIHLPTNISIVHTA
mmetsp:Transcript_28780/g.39565  ORF Transcript_28780/g.39565 Transcript_28780/m.39565 type:complete len:89 (-) Transcript_28780:116-382(-)